MKRRPFRVRNLLLAWSAYWLALIVVGLSPAISAIWRVTQAGPGKGNVNAAFGDGRLNATVIQDGITTYSGSTSLLSVALLLALPPLVMWAVFLVAAPRTINAEKSAVGEGPAVAGLKAGETGFFRSSSSTSKRSSRGGS
ncbi:MAG: hypothetical protein ACJ8AK_01750 [Gemmatimonadaceae bacterium]